MRRKPVFRFLIGVGVCGAAAGLLVPRFEAAAAQNASPAAPEAASTVIRISRRPPAGAIPLFTGTADQIHANFYQRYTNNPAAWTVDADGVATPNKADITSKQEFGDCYVHAEFRTPVDAQGKTIGEGNSGVGLQGRYEVQILDSYGHNKPNEEDCGAFYSQRPPRVNASKKPGEWQTYDIIFRAPRFDANGQLTEQPRATVFQNGILVQNNEAFTGMTGIQYGQYKEPVKAGPLVLQGDHNPVQFRNVWIVPL